MKKPTKGEQHKNYRQRIIQHLTELKSSDKIVTRQSLAKEFGCPPSHLTQAVKSLIQDSVIHEPYSIKGNTGRAQSVLALTELPQHH